MVLEEYGKIVIIRVANQIKTIIIKTPISYKLFVSLFCSMFLFSTVVWPIVNIVRGFDITLLSFLTMMLGGFLSTFLFITIWSDYYLKYNSETKVLSSYSDLFGKISSIKEYNDISCSNFEIYEEEVKSKTKYFIKLVNTDFRFGNLRSRKNVEKILEELCK